MRFKLSHIEQCEILQLVFRCFFCFTGLQCFIPVNLFSQELIIDSGFEILKENSDCVSPIQNFDKLKHWYALDATPDLFISNCGFEESDFVFWDESLRAPEGSNYAGVWSRWNSNDTYFTEGIATKLNAPLEAGATYVFRMMINNQGTFQGLDGSVAGCELDPEKHIDLYALTDSIQIFNDFGNGTSSTNAELVSSLTSMPITVEEGDEWIEVSTCFMARGGEKFFAIVLPLGSFGELPPCALTMATSGVFRSFYYAIDDLSLSKLELSIEDEIRICENQSIEIDLVSQIDNELLSSAEFSWNDGFIGPFRSFMPEGDLSITATLDCGEIPIDISIVIEDCEVNYYLPNVFTPNGDNRNDNFKIDISKNTSVSNFQLTVQDRWGNLIFITRSPERFWDGTFRSSPLASGQYFWRLNFETIVAGNNEQIVDGGSILLIR